MIKRILNLKTKTITFTAILLAASALVSRLLGLFRDNLLANLFSKSQTDIYFAAFRVPDFLYGILISGGIIAAFLPVFAETYRKNPERAQELTKNVLSFFLLGLVAISTILFFFTPQLTNIVTPGFSEAQKGATVTLTRIMFLSPILLGASAIFSSVIQYFNLFFAYALAPLLYNLGIILGILVFVPAFGIKGLAFGVILGALMHALIQLPPLLSHGIKLGIHFNPKSPGLRKILRLMAPRTVGAAAYHINLIVVTSLASMLSAGSISVFNFANNLQYVPIGLIGTSFAVASFPALSRNFVEKKKEEFSKNFVNTINQIVYLIVPLSVFVFVLRAQIVRLILGTSFLGKGNFGWVQTRLTAASLGIFAVSLFAAALVPFLSRVFFSLHDTKTPVKIALVAMGLNILLCFLFVGALSFPNSFRMLVGRLLRLKDIQDISVVGLVMALSISVITQFAFLSTRLKMKIKLLNYKEIWETLKKVLLVSFLSGILVYVSLQAYPMLGGATHTVVGLLLQTIIALIIGSGSYVLFSLVLKLKELNIIASSILSPFRR